MYFKLALRNVKKSYRDYLIYFLTLMFSVCLFYTFNSFQAQQAVMKINESQENLIITLSSIMNVVSIFVAIILAFLILYANNFLIKRRKKELGIYSILGMPKRKLSAILVYETLIIGFISLISGLFLGILISQVVTAITANLFVVPLNYSFVFSPSATLLTILSFTIIFTITMLFNTIVLNRYKLIDLLHADQKNAIFKFKNIKISFLLFILAIACLAWAYYEAETKGVTAFDTIHIIIFIGSLGTILFFLSLAGFLLTLAKSCKTLYFKDLNCFILRQIHSNINMNFLSMSIVCIMLLLSIGALSTGLSLNNSINTTIITSTPYDFSIAYPIQLRDNEYANNPNIPLSSIIKQLHINPEYIASQTFASTYRSDVRLNNPFLINAIKDNGLRKLFSENSNNGIQVIPLSAFNAARKKIGYEQIALTDKEIYAYSTTEVVSTAVHQILRSKPTLNVYGKQLQITNSSYDPMSIYTSFSPNEHTLAFVIQDNLIPPNTQQHTSYMNIELTKNITSKEFQKYFSDKFRSYTKTALTKYPITISMESKEDVYNNSKGMAVTFTYIGVYLGIVFMIASAVILALQQLSQANDNKKRYTILTKIGTEKKMMNRSILSQIAIYYFMPLALAIVHSIIGIRLVNNLVIMVGRGNILLPSVFTTGIILIIYGSYFLVTYFGYKNIIRS